MDIVVGSSDFAPEKGKSYVLNGAFLDPSGNVRQLGNYPMNGFSVFRVESFLSGDDLPYADYLPEDGIPEVFLRAAEQYRTMNNYVRVVPCRDVNDVYVFHQNELQLSDGAMPDPGTPNTCVITNDLAVRLGLGPGDELALSELRGTADDRYLLSATGAKQTYTVSGVATASSGYYGTVWAIAEDADTPLFGYLLGTVSLRNDEAEEAVEALRALVPSLALTVTVVTLGGADFLAAYGIALGDDYDCLVQVERSQYRMAEIPLVLRAVGSYAQRSDKAAVYVPLACHVPKALLADEPTGNLDSRNSEKLFCILEALAHQDGYCVVLVTHDEALGKRADEILRLQDGELV